MLSKKQQISKRIFDIIVAAIGIIIFLVPIVILILLHTLSISSDTYAVRKANQVSSA